MSKRLTDNQLVQQLADLEGWQLSEDGKSISRIFEFRDFNTTFGFMTRIALMAERLEHHPYWTNIANRVDITLTTREDGGLTDKDLVLARFISKLAGG